MDQPVVGRRDEFNWIPDRQSVAPVASIHSTIQIQK
jgi:hypothetical protein